MGFHEVDFPTTINWGSEGGPRFNTKITEVDSGAEERLSRWAGGRRLFNAAYGVRSYSDLYAVYKFFLLRLGSAYGFRYKDWVDFASTADGRLIVNGGAANVTSTDQIIGTGDGVTTQFQLTKTYSDSLVTRVRNIQKPVFGPGVLVNVNAVDKAEFTDYTVDYTTGTVTFSAAPAIGFVIKAGFQFAVPVRFHQSVDEAGLIQRLSDFGSGDIDAIPLIELVNEGTLQDEFFYGGAYITIIINDTQLSFGNGRVQRFTVNAAGKKLILPAITSATPTGGPYFFITNDGTQTVALKTSLGTLVINIPVGTTVTVVLSLDSSGAKTWWAW